MKGFIEVRSSGAYNSGLYLINIEHIICIQENGSVVEIFTTKSKNGVHYSIDVSLSYNEVKALIEEAQL